MTANRISAWLAIGLSVFGAGLKVVRVLRQHEWWPFFAYDYIAAGLLLVGAIAVLRGRGSGRLLAAGWGFGVAMFYGSFFGHLENWLAHTGPDVGFERTMSLFGGPFLALNVLGLVLALVPSRQA